MTTSSAEEALLPIAQHHRVMDSKIDFPARPKIPKVRFIKAARLAAANSVSHSRRRTSQNSSSSSWSDILVGIVQK
jgi:hypothetical protein